MAAYGSDDVGHLTSTGGDESRALDREKSRSYLVWIYSSMQVDRCKNGRNVLRTCKCSMTCTMHAVIDLQGSD